LRLLFQHLDSKRIPVHSKPLSPVAIVWDERTDRVPERVRVFLVPEMGEFVGDDVVLYFPRGEYETPVKHHFPRSVLTPSALECLYLDVYVG